MAVFAVTTSKNEIAADYFKRLGERLVTPDVFQHPFKGAAGVVPRTSEDVYIVSIQPIYPAVWLFSIVPLGSYVFLWRSAWLLAPGLFLLAVGVLWSPVFFYLMLRLGLRQAGYAGRVQWVSLGRAWRLFLGTD